MTPKVGIGNIFQYDPTTKVKSASTNLLYAFCLISLVPIRKNVV